MDYLTLSLLSSALSLDDLALAVALCLLIPRETLINRIMHSTKLALAFAIPTAVLQLFGWLVSRALFEWIASLSAWIVLLVFAELVYG